MSESYYAEASGSGPAKPRHIYALLEIFSPFVHMSEINDRWAAVEAFIWPIVYAALNGAFMSWPLWYAGRIAGGLTCFVGWSLVVYVGQALHLYSMSERQSDGLLYIPPSLYMLRMPLLAIIGFISIAVGLFVADVTGTLPNI